MAEHRITDALLSREVRVAVVGCGGTGSAIAGGLPRLHQCMLALGHPHGLRVTFYDGDRVSRSNTVRQAFSVGDVGALKAEVIAHRINLFYGLSWRGKGQYLDRHSNALSDYDMVISCVDTRASRAAVNRHLGGYRLRYWLDCGNNEFDGQFVLGEPMGGWHDTVHLKQSRLPTVADLFPETVDPEKAAPGPSCSAAEALRLQGPFVNEVIAHGALALLARLFTKGVIDYHGQFINLDTGKAVPILVPSLEAEAQKPAPTDQKKPGARARRRSRAAMPA